MTTAPRGAHHLGPHQFKSGQSGNPGGRPKSLLTATHIAGQLGKFWDMKRTDLFALKEDPNTPVGDVLLATMMLEAIKTADHGKLSMLLDRAVGKPKEITPRGASGIGLVLAPEDRELVIEAMRRGRVGHIDP